LLDTVAGAGCRCPDEIVIPASRQRLLRAPVDLHVHTHGSGGELPDVDVVLAAARRGVRVLARVNHNTLAGAGEFAATARANGVHAIHGCEISVCWQAAVWQVLAYHVDPADRLFAARLAKPGNPTITEALDWISAAGGVAVLAHPGRSMRPERAIAELRPLAEHGLAGIEAWTTWHDADTASAFAAAARRLNLLATQGSDFLGRSRRHAPAPGLLPAASPRPGMIVDGLAQLAAARA
jgi:predicted metal-dependent phosphoesterase TrpH